MKKEIVVIGAGFSGIAAATTLADQGFQVTVLEKNSTPGGRARSFQKAGFTFDMGPSWYWMPDVFDRYFERFGRKTSDFYDLQRLSPSYTVAFGQNDFLDIPAEKEALHQLFENLEQGSSKQLQKFMEQAAYKYEVGVNNLVYKPSRSLTEFMSPQLLIDVVRMDVFQSFYKHVRKFFKNDKLIRLMEFPILFLGAMPENTPALYSLMNYADMMLGTWYPKGGMFKIVEGMVKLAEEKGVEFRYGEAVSNFDIDKQGIQTVKTAKGSYNPNAVVASADYHHVESQLLPSEYRSYSEGYWQNRTMAPSSLIFYLGVNKKLDKLHHHTLFFDEDLRQHSIEIYEQPSWPKRPLFYVCTPSKTDDSVAPDGYENVFILIPVAPNLEDSEEVREKYYHIVMERLEKLTEQEIRPHVVFKRSYAHRDFISDYHAFRGNAYGLANTLRQTAILKPSLKSKKVRNLYYTGQLTVPGPGVPPSLISGQVVAKEVAKELS